MGKSDSDPSDPRYPDWLMRHVKYSLRPPEEDIARVVEIIMPKIRKRIGGEPMSDGDLRELACGCARAFATRLFCNWRREDVPTRPSESAKFLRDLFLSKYQEPEYQRAFAALGDTQIEVYLLFKEAKMGVTRIARTIATPEEDVQKYLDEAMGILRERLSDKAKGARR